MIHILLLCSAALLSSDHQTSPYLRGVYDARHYMYYKVSDCGTHIVTVSWPEDKQDAERKLAIVGLNGEYECEVTHGERLIDDLKKPTAVSYRSVENIIRCDVDEKAVSMLGWIAGAAKRFESNQGCSRAGTRNWELRTFSPDNGTPVRFLLAWNSLEEGKGWVYAGYEKEKVNDLCYHWIQLRCLAKEATCEVVPVLQFLYDNRAARAPFVHVTVGARGIVAVTNDRGTALTVQLDCEQGNGGNGT